MREEVFGGTEQPRTLPSPFVLVALIILTVALPKGDVAVLQSVGYFVRTRGVLNPRRSFVIDVERQARFVFFPAFS